MEPETTRRLAATTGFRTDSLEKVIHLGGIALQIEQHPLLGSALALKGGTALNLFSGQPLRLSVDLDFNSIRAQERVAAFLRNRWPDSPKYAPEGLEEEPASRPRLPGSRSGRMYPARDWNLVVPEHLQRNGRGEDDGS